MNQQTAGYVGIDHDDNAGMTALARIVGSSLAMQQVRSLVERVSRSELSSLRKVLPWSEAEGSSSPNSTVTKTPWPLGSLPTNGPIKRPAARKQVAIQKMASCRCQVRAMAYGMPPNGGFGMGIDRLAMLFSHQRSIRDVLLYPHLRSRD